MSRFMKHTLSSQLKIHKKMRSLNEDGLSSRTEIDQSGYEWTVDEQLGNFVLGKCSDEDDLYILSITIVSCEYFHLLGEAEAEVTPSGENYYWIIKYKAYDCEISSDPFQLSFEKDSRRTFIGDKAAARIRASGALFHQYLFNTTIEFEIFRAAGVNKKSERVGIAFVELKDLTNVDSKGIKASLHVIPYPETKLSYADFSRFKPELRVIVEMSVQPNYYGTIEAKDEENSNEFSQLYKTAVETHEFEDDIGEQSDHSDEADNQAPNDPILDPDPTDDGRTGSDFNTLENEVEPPQPVSSEIIVHPDNGTVEVNRDNPCQAENQKSSSSFNSTNSSKSADMNSDNAIVQSESNQACMLPETANSSRKPSAIFESVSKLAFSSPVAADITDGAGMSRVDGQGDHFIKNNCESPPKADLKNLDKDELTKFREGLKIKERAYLQILSEEWTKRDDEREKKASDVINQYTALKEKLDAREARLEQKYSEMKNRERELELFVDKMSAEHNHKIEEMKLRKARLKEQHEIEIEMLKKRYQDSQDEHSYLINKIKSLQVQLNQKDDIIHDLNAARAHWPSISLERKIVRLEEKNATLKEENARLLLDCNNYRNEAIRLAKRQNQINCENETQLVLQNEALRAQLFLGEQKKDLKGDQASVKEIAKQIEGLKHLYAKKANFNDSNLSHQTEKSFQSTSQNTDYSILSIQNDRRDLKKYLNPISPSFMTRKEINKEIKRLQDKRNHLMNTGAYKRTDPVVRDIDNALTRLASDLPNCHN